MPKLQAVHLITLSYSNNYLQQKKNIRFLLNMRFAIKVYATNTNAAKKQQSC